MNETLPAASKAASVPISKESRRSATDAPADTRQFLTFKLGGESYAAPILSVKEIIEFGQVTSVPMMPGFIRGVINLRGNVVSVVDLAVRFGQGRSKVGKRSCVVIIETAQEGEKHIMGMLVDGVDEVVEIPAADIDPPPTFGAKVRIDFIEGLAKYKDRFVILLKLNQVLAVAELAHVAEEYENESEFAGGYRSERSATEQGAESRT